MASGADGYVTSSGASGYSDNGTLPFTGADIGVVGLIGLILAVVGVGLYSRVRPQRSV